MIRSLPGTLRVAFALGAAGKWGRRLGMAVTGLVHQDRWGQP